MKCKNIKNKFLLYIDQELPQLEMLEIGKHLKNCQSCTEKLNTYSIIYRPSVEQRKIQAPNFLWEKIYLKISEPEKRLNPFTGLLQNLLRYAITVVVIVIFGLAAMTGFFLGKQAVSMDAKMAATYSDLMIQNEVTDETLIDSFDDLPPSSLGAVYLTLKSE